MEDHVYLTLVVWEGGQIGPEIFLVFLLYKPKDTIILYLSCVFLNVSLNSVNFIDNFSKTNLNLKGGGGRKYDPEQSRFMKKKIHRFHIFDT